MTVSLRSCGVYVCLYVRIQSSLIRETMRLRDITVSGRHSSFVQEILYASVETTVRDKFSVCVCTSFYTSAC